MAAVGGVIPTFVQDVVDLFASKERFAERLFAGTWPERPIVREEPPAPLTSGAHQPTSGLTTTTAPHTKHSAAHQANQGTNVIEDNIFS